MNILSPSILAADFWELGVQIQKVQAAGAQYLHVDVMDGSFVPAISLGMPVLSSIRKQTKLFLDVHLMIQHPERYIREFAACGADLINFHYEAAADVEAAIGMIRECGVKAGITIKPDTPASAIYPYLPLVDMILVMTVEPGFGGQKIMPSCLEKVKEIRRYGVTNGIHVDIEVDGGITKDNIGEVLAAGANVIVAGSAVFGGDIEDNVRTFMTKLQ